jgi:hypothetical protein
MCKAKGKTLYRQIYPALSCNIPDEDFSFLLRRNTTLRLLRVTEYITDKFNELAYTTAIFLDVSKAYDTVWTTEFVSKIYTAGLPDTSPFC